MDCPVCKNVSLLMSERQGVEIDYCPQCRGVWLDRGELDKIIEKVEESRPVAQAAPMQERGREAHPPREGYRDDRYRDDHRRGDRDYHHKKKRKSLLGELFDF